jgi:hypothetical protein
VEILERENHRSSGRQLLDQSNHGVRDPKPQIQGCSGLPHELLRPPQQQPGDFSSPSISGIGVEPEGLRDQPEGTVTLEVVAGASKDLRSPCFRGFECLGHETRLPDSRLALDQRQPALARSCTVEKGAKHLEFRAARDECGTRLA